MSNPIVIPDLDEYPETYNDIIMIEDIREDWPTDPDVKEAFDRMTLAISNVDDWEVKMQIKLTAFGECLSKSWSKSIRKDVNNG